MAVLRWAVENGCEHDLEDCVAAALEMHQVWGATLWHQEKTGREGSAATARLRRSRLLEVLLWLREQGGQWEDSDLVLPPCLAMRNAQGSMKEVELPPWVAL